MMDEKIQSQKVFSGIRWSAIGQVVNQVLRFCVTIVLARLIAPEDFGLLGMATVITGFIGIFHSLGTAGIIVQKETLAPELLSSLYVLNIAMGCVLSMSLALSAPYIAILYNNPDVTLVVRLLGLTFVISSLGLVHRSLLRRDMCFDRLVQIDFATAIVQGCTAIVLAYLGWKVWALVTASITSSIISTCLLWRMRPWHFLWIFRWAEVKEAMGFGLNLTGSQIVEYLLSNTDKFIIARYLGPMSLGYYSMAYNLYKVPQQTITGIITSVLFPVFSRMQNDDAQLRKGFLRAAGGVALLTFPLMLGVVVIAGPIVIGLLGAKWRPIIPLVMILAPIGILQSIGIVAGQLYLAKGRSDWLFWWNLFASTVTILSFLCGLPWGIIGVAIAYAVVMLPLGVVSWAIPCRLINLPLIVLLKMLWPYASSSTIMASLVLVCRLILENAGFDSVLVISICVLLGGVIYIAIILFWQLPALDDITRLLSTGNLRFRLNRMLHE